MYLALTSDHSTPHGKAAIQSVISDALSDQTVFSVTYFASQPDPGLFFFNSVELFYRALGAVHVHYVDSNTSQIDIEQALNASLIHLSGGDTFAFLSWLQERSLLDTLNRLARDGKPFVGVSAGAMLMTPSIESAPLCGDKNEVGIQNLFALDLAPFLFVPHAEKNQQEIERVFQLLSQKRHQVVLCTDDDALVIKNDEVIEFGTPLWV
ncbi:Type 1 glutamine amidotransferase-like domain-containing protein [Veronia pacifica]|uniref:Peptidase S51 n=1 Tax=Veronia pacifica TaxID=1080227 RepID=A0A1C3ER56_9GAMM|nr:Type 1 glutamine amidotransferase-like domain-containing protein [Veronia pacifica]ODA35717.1 hypothetical protein A8L45_03675 [Veronia pacifica]